MPFSRSSEGEIESPRTMEGCNASEAASSTDCRMARCFVFIPPTFADHCYLFVTCSSIVCPASRAKRRSGDLLLSADSKFAPDAYHFARAHLDFDELGRGKRLAGVIDQRGNLFLGSRVENVRRVTPGIGSIETEVHPAVAAR